MRVFSFKRFRFCFLCMMILFLFVLPVQADEAPVVVRKANADALQKYVDAKDDSYRWKMLGQHKLPDNLGTVYRAELTSQTWQGVPWKHSLAVFEPKKLVHPKHCLLFITGGTTGGKVGLDDLLIGAKLAQMTGARCAILLQVPNQPLMGGRYEDDLISETFLKYLKTGDETWPLLFPMTKSAVRAMDAVQEIVKKHQEVALEKFVVTGASKRGWTTWLSSVVDKRVIGIAPIVIDTLNMPAQMKHQIEVWGKYSDSISDYTSKGLVKIMKEKPEIPLWRWVDPYTYCKEIKIPKLIINGTNDQYWVLDALNIYWKDLVGEKHILYIPNANHGLGNGKSLAMKTLAAFVKHLAAETPMPQLQWKHLQEEGQMKLSITSSQKPTAVRLWSATSKNGDFRKSKWRSTLMKKNEKGYSGQAPIPVRGNAAIYGEAKFEIEGLKYSLTTQIHRE